jgi:hypothetical protein
VASPPDIATLPGYRRRFRITPLADRVTTALEDDYHHMVVTVHHANGIATAIEADLLRAPWTTCPGSPAKAIATFTGVALAEFTARGEKTANCTHLHDLAVLAATHAGDRAATVIDILVSDQVGGKNRAELRRNGETLLRWVIEGGFTLVEPAQFGGVHLMKIKPLLEASDAEGQEWIKLLRWGAIVAHGRAIPMSAQDDASRMPPNCFTFQPERKGEAKRVGVIKDFSTGGAAPLEAQTVTA